MKCEICKKEYNQNTLADVETLRGFKTMCESCEAEYNANTCMTCRKTVGRENLEKNDCCSVCNTKFASVIARLKNGNN